MITDSFSSLMFLGMVKVRQYRGFICLCFSSLMFLGMVKGAVHRSSAHACFSSLMFLGMVKEQTSDLRSLLVLVP